MSPAVNQAMNTVGLAHKVATLSISSSSLCSLTKVGSSYFAKTTTQPKKQLSRMPNGKGQYFDALSNDVIVKIFQWLNTDDLLAVGVVCRRFSKLIWNAKLWRVITLKGDTVIGDKALNCIFRKTVECGDGSLPTIERVMISDGCKVSEKGIHTIIRRCPNITHLQIQFCNALTNSLLYEIVMKCINLQHLDLTGCPHVSRVSLNIGIDTPRKMLLQYVDLTDCPSLDDAGLKTIMKNSPLVIYLYLRRCVQLTDMSLKILPKCCIALKELSVSDCVNITDFGLYELAKLGQTLRYLSVAKCQVSDVGLKHIARRCYKLRYVNVRGCEGISDDSIIVLARSCSRLRSLDIGKCEVSDNGCFTLAECCPNLKKLSLKSCDMVTDEGIKYISYYCRGLQQLNIQDCVITADGYNSVKKFCRRCVIQHNNISILG